MKYVLPTALMRTASVAPHAGAWIEMLSSEEPCRRWFVAPHAGAWIEMSPAKGWETNGRVAPHAGAWIEIAKPLARDRGGYGRAPRGRVD